MNAGIQSLDDLIKWLESQPPKRVVRDGFWTGHSDRGNYENVAFNPIAQTTIGEMLIHAKEIYNTTQYGWNGGEYKMHGGVSTYIGFESDPGEPITTFNYKVWEEDILSK